MANTRQRPPARKPAAAPEQKAQPRPQEQEPTRERRPADTAGGGYGISAWDGRPTATTAPTKSAQIIAQREADRRSGKK